MLAQALAVFLLAVLPADVPFADLDYEAALAQAKEQQKLLFVDFTASWCGPCKKMEAETWPAADVVAWLGENAIAIQVDVDKQKELAGQFSIRSVPTVVVLRGGEEYDRVVGYKGAASFLAWARDVAAGKRSSDELTKRATDPAQREYREDVEARHKLARDLLRAERYDLALEHYLWVWPESRSARGYAGVRLSFMLSEMTDLAREYPPAKEAFLEILDGLQAQVDAEGVPEFLPWQEWWSMCQYFGEQRRVVAWYETRRDATGCLFADRSEEFLVQLIVREVADVLIKKDRAVDAARLFRDPYAYAEGAVASFEEMRALEARMDQERSQEFREMSETASRSDLIEKLVVVYTALLGAGRSEEAVEIGELLLDTLDTPGTRLALVRAGADVAQGPEESLERWLDEAEAAGADVTLLRWKLVWLAESRAGASGD